MLNKIDYLVFWSKVKIRVSVTPFLYKTLSCPHTKYKGIWPKNKIVLPQTKSCMIRNQLDIRWHWNHYRYTLLWGVCNNLWSNLCTDRIQKSHIVKAINNDSKHHLICPFCNKKRQDPDCILYKASEIN